MTTINQNRTRMNAALDPSSILQTAFGFWHSKVLLTAVEFGVFTKLAGRRLTGAELGAELQFHPRAIADFFDALVAMKFLGREGDGPQARYFNTPEGSLFSYHRISYYSICPSFVFWKQQGPKTAN